MGTRRTRTKTQELGATEVDRASWDQKRDLDRPDKEGEEPRGTGSGRGKRTRARPQGIPEDTEIDTGEGTRRQNDMTSKLAIQPPHRTITHQEELGEEHRQEPEEPDGARGPPGREPAGNDEGATIERTHQP